MKRPEYVTCVKADVGESHDLHGKTWCGLEGHQLYHVFLFTSVDHAAFNGRAGQRLVVCPECAVAIMKGLLDGVEGARFDEIRKALE